MPNVDHDREDIDLQESDPVFVHEDDWVIGCPCHT